MVVVVFLYLKVTNTTNMMAISKLLRYNRKNVSQDKNPTMIYNTETTRLCQNDKLLTL